MHVALLIYFAGAAAGLAFTDARLPARLALALAWPIGPAAFVAVIALLLLAALYIFPMFGAIVAVGGLAAWWAFS